MTLIDNGPRNGWRTAEQHPSLRQLVTKNGNVDSRLTYNNHYAESAVRNYEAPMARRWTTTLIRIVDGVAFVGQGPTNDAAYRAARVAAGDPLT